MVKRAAKARGARQVRRGVGALAGVTHAPVSPCLTSSPLPFPPSAPAYILFQLHSPRTLGVPIHRPTQALEAAAARRRGNVGGSSRDGGDQ